MKKSKLAKIAMLGMVSSFCFSAKDISPSDHEDEVVMHKKSEKESSHENSKGGKGLHRGGSNSCGGQGGCGSSPQKGGSKGADENKNACAGSGSCNSDTSYNEFDEEEDSYQILRTKRYRNSEGE